MTGARERYFKIVTAEGNVCVYTEHQFVDGWARFYGVSPAWFRKRYLPGMLKESRPDGRPLFEVMTKEEMAADPEVRAADEAYFRDLFSRLTDAGALVQ